MGTFNLPLPFPLFLSLFLFFFLLSPSPLLSSSYSSSSSSPKTLSTIAIDMGFQELQRMLSAFYDTRPLLYQQPPEVVVNGITQASFNLSVSCLIARYPKSLPIPPAERDNFDTKLDLTHNRHPTTPRKEHKKPADRARPLPNKPSQQHTLLPPHRDAFEIVYVSQAIRTYEQFTWSQWGTTLFRCPISDSHHRTLFSDDSSRFFVLLVPSEKGIKPTLPSPHSLFSEHWFPINLMPNHPSPPLTLSSSSPSSSSSSPSSSSTLSIEQFLDPYLNEEPTTPPSLAICTAPCFGQFPHVREWFEYNKMMGVEKVIFYDYRIEADDTKEAFRKQEEEGMVERIGYQQGMPDDVLRFGSRWGWWWELNYFAELDPNQLKNKNENNKINNQLHHPPSGPSPSTLLSLSSKKITKNRFVEGGILMPNPIIPPVTRRMTWGQSAVITDCLLRTVGRYRWVFFFDFDELVVPHKFVNLSSVPLSPSSSSSSSSFFSPPYSYWLHKLVSKYHKQSSPLPLLPPPASSSAPSSPSYPNFIPSIGIRNYFFCPYDGNCTTKTPSSAHPFTDPPNCSSPLTHTAANLYPCTSACPSSLPSNHLLPSSSSQKEKYLRFVSYFSPFRSRRFLKVGRTKHVVDPLLVFFPSIHNIKIVTSEVFGPGGEEGGKVADEYVRGLSLGSSSSISTPISYISSPLTSSSKSSPSLFSFLSSSSSSSSSSSPPTTSTTPTIPSTPIITSSPFSSSSSTPHSLATLAPHAHFLKTRPNLYKWALHIYPSLQKKDQQKVQTLLQALNGVLISEKGKKGKKREVVGESVPGQVLRWVLLGGDEGDLHHLRKDDTETCEVWDFSFLNTFGEYLFERVKKLY